MSSTADKWRLTAVSHEREAFTLLGQNPWNAAWLRADVAPVFVEHPGAPGQTRLTVYELDAPRSIRFAAAEVSNGVWAFYTPA